MHTDLMDASLRTLCRPKKVMKNFRLLMDHRQGLARITTGSCLASGAAEHNLLGTASPVVGNRQAPAEATGCGRGKLHLDRATCLRRKGCGAHRTAVAHQ